MGDTFSTDGRGLQTLTLATRLLTTQLSRLSTVVSAIVFKTKKPRKLKHEGRMEFILSMLPDLDSLLKDFDLSK